MNYFDKSTHGEALSRVTNDVDTLIQILCQSIHIVCVPPTSSYGLYNSVKAPKTLSLYQMTGHYWYQEQWDEWQAWIIQQLKK